MHRSIHVVVSVPVGVVVRLVFNVVTGNVEAAVNVVAVVEVAQAVVDSLDTLALALVVINRDTLARNLVTLVDRRSGFNSMVP